MTRDGEELTIRARRNKRIVMLVANAVSDDSRVQKTAASAAGAGYHVTIIGLSKSGSRTVERVRDVTIVRVHVPFDTYSRAKRRAVLAAKGKRAHARRIFEAARRVKVLVKPRMQARRSRATQAHGRLDRLKSAGVSRIELSSLRMRIVGAEALLLLEQSGVRAADKALRWAEQRATSVAVDQAIEEEMFRAKLEDFKQAYLAELSTMSFDLVHAHDFTMIDCARQAVVVAGNRPSFVYDAHEWVRGLTHLPLGTQIVGAAVETEHISAADAVITVSPVLVERLREEHRLREYPALVLNAPVAAAYDPESPLSVRKQAGLEEDVPLAVYGGAVKASRGVATIIRALPMVPELHLAVVASDARSPGVKDVLTEAEGVGVRDRVHIVPYVEQHQVSSYLRTADVGIHPLLASGNAELALPNKVFEYLHAGLPMVVSDMPSMAGLVRHRGWGEVFAANDPEDLAAALRRVLAAPHAYDAGLQDPIARDLFSWERQAQTLVGVYDRLLLGIGAEEAPEPVAVPEASWGSDPGDGVRRRGALTP